LTTSRQELTGWLNGVSGDRWLDQPKKDGLIKSAYNAYMQGHFARTPDKEPAEDAAFPRDQYYNPPEGEPLSVKVLREADGERVELREHRYTKIEVTLRDGKEVARDLVGLRLNPWWYPHDLLHRLDRRRRGLQPCVERGATGGDSFGDSYRANAPEPENGTSSSHDYLNLRSHCMVRRRRRAAMVDAAPKSPMNAAEGSGIGV